MQDDDSIKSTNKNQIRPSTSNNNSEHFDNALDNGVENPSKAAQSKMTVIEINIDPLEEEVSALKQEKIVQHEETKRLQERLAKIEAGIHDNDNNDLNYNSSDNEDDHNNDINYDTE
jgi:hypothetical protein